MTPTRFEDVYNVFLTKITDDMYLELTKDETLALLNQMLTIAVHSFEFPRQSLDYEYRIVFKDEEGSLKYYVGDAAVRPEEDAIVYEGWTFVNALTAEEINILADYMIVEWLGQQLASVENVRMKYSGSDFKFTSQANHMQKLLQMKKDYERRGFHDQRLYKRRIKDVNGIYRSTIRDIMTSSDAYQAITAPSASDGELVE